MRKLLVSVAIATATLAAVPAAAQYRGDDRGWDHRDDRGFHQRGPDGRALQELVFRLNQVDQRIERSARRGTISTREAFGLRREANQVRREIQFARRDGLSGREFGALNARVNRLEQRLRNERRDFDGRRG